MKFKTTRKAITNGYKTIVSIGYCNAQHLFRYEDPIAYTTRAEGWGADVYQVGSVAIVTGYAPFGNIRPDYDLVRKYDREAEAICSSSSFDWNTAKVEARALLERFIKEVTE
jgi:hypothetical protein